MFSTLRALFSVRQLSRFLGGKKSARHTSIPRSRYQPTLESLEDRWLPSATAAGAAAGATGATTGGTTNMTATTSTMTTPAPTTQDNFYLLYEVHANQMEMLTGQLAMQLGSSNAVKAFGANLFISHYHALQAMVPALQIEGLPAMPLGPSDLQFANALASLKGQNFDRLFTAIEAMDHAQNINLSYLEETTGSDPAAKAYATEIMPLLQQHLQIASILQQMETQQANGNNGNGNNGNNGNGNNGISNSGTNGTNSAVLTNGNSTGTSNSASTGSTNGTTFGTTGNGTTSNSTTGAGTFSGSGTGTGTTGTGTTSGTGTTGTGTTGTGTSTGGTTTTGTGNGGTPSGGTGSTTGTGGTTGI